MSISGALNNAISGLAASSRLAEVVSSNLSNALTDGYGRRSVDLSAAQVGSKGGGVRIDGISRASDPAILADRRLADAVLTGQKRNAAALMRVENQLGNVDSVTGLSARFSAFERALISASGDPASQPRLTAAVSRLSDVVDSLLAATRSTQAMRQDADAAIADDVDRLNTGLRQVADLNTAILRVRTAGQDPSALLDARQRVIDDVATIVPLREVPRDNGTVALLTLGGATLLDGRAAQFGFARTPTITADMTLASGALSGLTLDNRALDPDNGIGQLDGGSLGAAFAMRDNILVAVQIGLDDIAADLITRFQDPAYDPTLSAGAPGLLTDAGASLDLSDLPGLAGRITLHAALDPSKGGDPALLRDGLFATAPGAVGDSSQLNRWIAALAQPRADHTGGDARSAAGHIADFSAQLGNKRLAAQEAVSFTTARWDSLRQAELAIGVNSDFELQMLLRVEQAYAANAKVMQTVNAMMQLLMEI